MSVPKLHIGSAITQAVLKELIAYDPETGAFTWLVIRKGYGGGVWPGKPAGQINKYGYLVLCLNQERHFAHRLAWLYMTGEWPVEEIDHINRVPLDNRWRNLRPADATQNNLNTRRRSDNTTGVKGVGYRRGKWTARIKIYGKSIYLGQHATLEAAADARRAAEAKYHGEFAPA